MASTISTPGITGMRGKCPWKKGSLTLTFLMPMALTFGTTSTTLSIISIGYRCGIMRMTPLMSISAMVGPLGPS